VGSALPVEMDRARRAGTPLVVALLDLDYFKVFNDTYGHQAGDQLLRSATETWRSLLRSTDLLARYGGEEFAVLLPSSTLGEAVEVVDRLRVATPLAQTFSAGVALWHGTETSDQLVARADKALYQAKQAGRNQVLAADSPRAGRRHTHDPAGMARLAAADRPSP
jgi:diguanylate cyclase